MTSAAPGQGAEGEHDAQEQSWRTLRPSAVSKAIQTLWSSQIHNSFPAYLCLKLLSVRDGTTQGLRPNWREFFELYFEMPGGPDGRPYLRPFSDRHAVPEAMWLGRNVSGSFSPSSLRAGGPFSQVVDVTGSGVNSQYTLRDRHWELALTHLADGAPIPACSLATFLYRDYGFDPSIDPTAANLLKPFRNEFGYTGAQGELEFGRLYRDDSVEFGSELFE